MAVQGRPNVPVVIDLTNDSSSESEPHGRGPPQGSFLVKRRRTSNKYANEAKRARINNADLESSKQRRPDPAQLLGEVNEQPKVPAVQQKWPAEFGFLEHGKPMPNSFFKNGGERTPNGPAGRLETAKQRRPDLSQLFKEAEEATSESDQATAQHGHFHKNRQSQDHGKLKSSDPSYSTMLVDSTQRSRHGLALLREFEGLPAVPASPKPSRALSKPFVSDLGNSASKSSPAIKGLISHSTKPPLIPSMGLAKPRSPLRDKLTPRPQYNAQKTPPNTKSGSGKQQGLLEAFSRLGSSPLQQSRSARPDRIGVVSSPGDRPDYFPPPITPVSAIRNSRSEQSPPTKALIQVNPVPAPVTSAPSGSFNNLTPQKLPGSMVAQSSPSSPNPALWDELDQDGKTVIKAMQRCRLKRKAALLGTSSNTRKARTPASSVPPSQLSTPSSRNLQSTVLQVSPKSFNKNTLPSSSPVAKNGISLAVRSSPAKIHARHPTVTNKSIANVDQRSGKLPTPNFDKSSLKPVPKGTSWRPAEDIVMIYIYEHRAHEFRAPEVDAKFGRTWPKTTATTYVKWHQQLKNEKRREKLGLKKNLAALQQILTLDWDMERTVSALEDFMHGRGLPHGLVLPAEEHLPEPVKHSGLVINDLGKMVHHTQDSISAYAPSATPDSRSTSVTGIRSDGWRVRRSNVNYATNAQVEARTTPSTMKSAIGLVRRQTIFHERLEAKGSSPSCEEGTASRLLPLASRAKVFQAQPVKRGIKTYPYLSHTEQHSVSDSIRHIDWGSTVALRTSTGTLIHQPMSRHEKQLLSDILTEKSYAEADWDLVTKLKRIVKATGRPYLDELAKFCTSKLKHRSAKSVKSFFDDVLDCKPQNTSLQIRSTRPHTDIAIQGMSRTLVARTMEQRHRFTKARVLSTIGPASTYNDMSGDVGTVAFSANPNMNIFAAGSMCLTDEHSMQYNNPRNLMVGDADSRVVQELAYHYHDRPKAKEGKNSWESTYRTQDRRLFDSVPMVDFSIDGKYMLSGGYDGSIRCFGTSSSSGIDYITKDSGVDLKHEINLGGAVDLLRISKTHGKVATGAQLAKNGISIWSIDEGRFDLKHQFTPEYTRDLHPSTLQWGSSQPDSHLLLAGFIDKKDDFVNYGQLSMWNGETGQLMSLRPSSGVVFDVNWAPTSRRFATVMRPFASSMVNKGAKSVVRIYQPNDLSMLSPWRSIMELDCPAVDVNDVVFCPYDEAYVAVGSTTGQVYVYDIRQIGPPLHIFSHGKAVAELGSYTKDTGIRFCAWNDSRHGLVTGSSDGVVKTWDIFRASENAHTADLVSLNSGVMAGAFSPDFNRLIIGEVNRSFTIVEPFNQGRKISELDAFDVVEAETPAPLIEPVSESAAPRTNGNKCKIPLCRALQQSLGDCDYDDSGRSKGRIPANLLTSLEQMGISDKQLLAKTVARCTHCGAPSRPTSNNDMEQAQFPLCERCGFSCLRCGERRKLKQNLEHVSCSCGGNWTIGAIGYYSNAILPNEVPDRMEIDSRPLQPVQSPKLTSIKAEESETVDEFGYDDHYFAEFNLKQWYYKDDCFVDILTGTKYEKSGLERRK